MKRYLSIFLWLYLIGAAAAGCAQSGTVESDANPRQAISNNAQTQARTNEETNHEVDVDLTTLSSTMVYAEVYNMMTSPDEYLGKTIKVDGLYYADFYDETSQYYHYVIIEDAAACCAQGLEFLWKGEHTYPDDYPENNTKVEITGVFGSYEELEDTYYYLAVDDILILTQNRFS